MRTVTEAIHMICSASEQQGPIKLSVDEQRLFLDHIMCKARQGDVVTPEEVDLLCNLAGWHMMPPPHNWNGTLEIQETERAVAEAKAAMSV